MKNKISLILLLALGLCSCEERFELNDIGGEPRMYVECYAGLADTTIVQLYKAMPVNAKASDGRDFTLKRLDFKINGTPVSLKSLSDSLSWFYTDSPISAGSKLSLEVETDETAPISATATVPTKPAFTTTAQMIGGPVMPYIQFTVNFQGEATPTDRYGIGIKQYIKTHRDDGSEDIEYDMSAAPTMINGDIAAEHSLTVMGYPESFNFGMFSGEDLEDGKTINAIMMYDPREYTWEETKYDDEGNETGTVTVTLSLKLQIQILRFSDESYGYLNSLYNRQDNLLAMLGFCPPTVAYTNIAGGYGVLGGLSLAESEIIDIADLL
ncbi:MAG: DUF4249 domain-containing protein [Bacteroidales bacterium]|nr:DUF4249 domain-containing protein [Bacteroidales bacterium]